MRSLVAVLGAVLSLTIQADVEINRHDSSRRQLNDRADAEIIQLYFSLSDLSLDDQRLQMWGLTSTTKAALWTYNIDRYLRDHPELSVEAQEVLREGIRLVRTPAWFDIAPGSFGYEPKSIALEELKGRMKSVLSPQTIVETFIRLGAEPVSALWPSAQTPIADPKSRQAPRAEIYGCTCAGQWECGYFSDYSCYDSYCDWVPHCGIFHNEYCTGKCKSNY